MSMNRLTDPPIEVRSLEIKKTVNLQTLPSYSDFWILGKNGNYLVISTPDSDKISIENNTISDHPFAKDINFINENYNVDEDEEPIMDPNLIQVHPVSGMDDDHDIWARDLIASKSSSSLFIPDHEMSIMTYGNEIIKNNNFSPNIQSNYPVMKFSHKPYPMHVKAAPVIMEGGNYFICVNALEKAYIVMGEGCLNSQCQNNPDEIHAERITAEKKFPVIGSKSKINYQEGSSEELQNFLNLRRSNKQMIKNTMEDVSILVIPNSWNQHIDLEMTILPNGVVLLHSFPEAFKLLASHKNDISKQCDYDKLISSMRELEQKCQPFLTRTKIKLEKNNFIVKEVCGFATTNDNCNGLIAMGFNGLPAVLADGQILYTLPPNAKWFNDYFTQILMESGVSIIHQIKGQTSLKLLTKHNGFFRCQTNTIPRETVNDTNAKKTKSLTQLKNQPELKKQKLSY